MSDSIVKLIRQNPTHQPYYVKTVKAGKSKYEGREFTQHEPTLTDRVEEATRYGHQQAEGIRQKLDPTQYEVVPLVDECLRVIALLRE